MGFSFGLGSIGTAITAAVMNNIGLTTALLLGLAAAAAGRSCIIPDPGKMII